MHSDPSKLGCTIWANEMSAGWGTGTRYLHKENKCEISPVSLSRCSQKLCAASSCRARLPLIHDHDCVRQMSLQGSTALSQEISDGVFLPTQQLSWAFPCWEGGREGGDPASSLSERQRRGPAVALLGTSRGIMQFAGAVFHAAWQSSVW